MEKVIEELFQRFADAGLKSAVIPIRHLPDLKFDMENLLEQGILCMDFVNEVLSRYDMFFNFEPPADFPTAQSIFIVAAPQPRFRVEFKLSGKTYPVIIPPTYLHETDKKVSDTISLHLGNYGYKVYEAILPEKSLAVHCGLAKYGRNNIAYIDGWGSYFRLKTFFSDIPCMSDNWQELKMMDCCNKCPACFRSCPTQAITEGDDRFLIHGNRCITFFNEGTKEFPGWIDPAWHNCLIGCMICQDVCPANKDFTNWVEEIECFSEDETRIIMSGVPRKKLPDEMIKKLKKIYMFDHYDLLQRNLRVLM